MVLDGISVWFEVGQGIEFLALASHDESPRDRDGKPYIDLEQELALRLAGKTMEASRYTF